MVYEDNDFVFNLLLVENYKRWFAMKKYYYKECIYCNYLIFLESYALEHNATKCKQLLGNLFEEEGLYKNRHKKNLVKYIKWKT